MVNVSAVWAEALPTIMREVTGVGVWTALKSSTAIAYEDGMFVLGLPSSESDLAGHLRLPASRRAIESEIAQRIDGPVELRVINGTTATDWDHEKKRDAEKRKLQEQALARTRAEIAAGKSWEQIYEELSRTFSSIPARSLPQNRARFLLEAVNIVSQALEDIPITDELAERNYARCLERIAQYAEVPSTIVALRVLDHTFSK